MPDAPNEATPVQAPERCAKCGATLVVCKLCGAKWCLDEQPHPLKCPGCGKYPRDGS